MRWRADLDTTNEWCSFLGGSGSEGILDVAIDEDGDLFLFGWTGTTSSSTLTSPTSTPPGGGSFPICTPIGAYVQTHTGIYDNFVMEFNESNELVWSTYLGTNNDDIISVDLETGGMAGMAISSGSNPNIYVTSSILQLPIGPLTSPAFNTPPPDPNSYYDTISPGSQIIYIAKFVNRNLDWFTLFGGEKDTVNNVEGRMRCADITVSDYGYIFLTGRYDSEINQSLVDYCTVPTNGEFAFCDFNGNAYMETDINGNTGEPLDSVNFNRTFIACFDNNGILSWSTRYGNGRNNIALSIHAHHNDKLYIAGYAMDPATTDNYSYTLEDLNTSTLTDYFQSNYGNNSYDAVAARFSIPMLTIGIEENKIFDQGKIFPNPTTDIVYISIPNIKGDGSYPYTIMDLSGRIISNGNLLGTLPSVDLNALANGLYIINVNVKNRIFTFKIIKQ